MAQQDFRPSPDENNADHHAHVLCEIGVEQLHSGQIKTALDTFEESLRVKPTAEGYTFRAWATSYFGELNEAISDCMRAIKLDRDFGNPYNDIGVYLMKMARLDEALVWFERAKNATRYKDRHFPFLNTGHIHQMRGDQNLALNEYVQALDIDPDNVVARKAIAEMEMDFYP